MTKWKGKAASVSPCLAIFATSVSMTALMSNTSLAGSCTGSAGAYTCAGAANSSRSDTPVSINISQPLTITTTAGFGIDTSAFGVSAFDLITSAGNLSFEDQNGSAITGGNYGILAINTGTGSLSISATGLVTAEYGDGIQARNVSSNTGDLTINAKDVTSYDTAIRVHNGGQGALSVVATGTIYGGGYGDGIHASNSDTSKGDITIVANGLVSGINGIVADHKGQGSLSITSTGKALGDHFGTYGGDGIWAKNSSRGSRDLTIKANDVNGYFDGIYAYNGGQGALSVTATGTVSGGSYGYGIEVSNSDASKGDITIVAHNSYANNSAGILAKNSGQGSVNVTSTGTVKAKERGTGILAQNLSAGGGDIKISAVNVSGDVAAINTNNQGKGLTGITLSGVVTGGAAAAVDITALEGTAVNVTLNAGADVGSGNGQAIVEENANTNLMALVGSKISGLVSLGDGSDTAFISDANISALTVLDGGDDTSVEDGFVDHLTLASSFGGQTLSGDIFLNWERIDVNGLTMTAFGSALNVGTGTSDSGLVLSNGANLTLSQGYAVNGFVNLGTGSLLNAAAGNGKINGSLLNDGTVTLQNSRAGDVLTVNGDLSGTGVLAFDTVLGDDNSATDMLLVTGDFAADAKIIVKNIGGKGAQTGTGIKLVDIVGDLTGSAVLVGNFVTDDGRQAIIEGAYAYTLTKDTAGDLVLVSQDTTGGGAETVLFGPRFQPGAPIFEYYPVVLQVLNMLPSYHQRASALRSGKSGKSEPTMSFAMAGDEPASPFWMMFSGAHEKLKSGLSRTDADGKSNLFKLDAGVDLLHKDFAGGRFVGGVVLSYGHSWSDVQSRFGKGKIDTDAFGFGLVGNWTHSSGFYIDNQIRYNWFLSDLKSDSLGRLKNNHRGHGYVGSVEIGKVFGLTSGLLVIPQAQLTYSRVDFRDFTGHNGEDVAMNDGDRLEMRAGLQIQKQIGADQSSSAYGLINGYYKFDDETAVNVSGITLINGAKRFSLELGGGGQFEVSRKTRIFGEVTARSSFDSDLSVQGSIGVRWSF